MSTSRLWPDRPSWTPVLSRWPAKITVLQDLDPGEEVMAPAHVELNAVDAVHATWMHHAPGSPQAPLGWDEVSAKVVPCAVVGGFGEDAVDSLLGAVRGLESLGPPKFDTILPKTGSTAAMNFRLSPEQEMLVYSTRRLARENFSACAYKREGWRGTASKFLLAPA